MFKCIFRSSNESRKSDPNSPAPLVKSSLKQCDQMANAKFNN